MPLYTRFSRVQALLLGKVTFTDDPENENAINIGTARVLVDEAEGEVEMDLSSRYFAPFQTDDGGAFSLLPMRPTRNLLMNINELLSVVRILESDFGRGTVVNAEAFSKDYRTRYEALRDKMIELVDDETKQWKYPPLPNLRLAPHNAAGDDGFAGMVMVTSRNIGDYPIERINAPDKTYWNISDTDDSIASNVLGWGCE